MIRVTLHNDEKATVYADGGIAFNRNVNGIGWVYEDKPSVAIVRLALAVREAHYPHLAPLNVETVMS